jgi:hypothetical protein
VPAAPWRPLLLIAAGTELLLEIDAEGKSRESIVDPLSI